MPFYPNANWLFIVLGIESDPKLGGKAGILRELQLAGFRVPDFDVLMVHPGQSQSGIDVMIEAVVERFSFPLAVRSSASLEDGREASFAGQFDSYLNLTNRADLMTAVARCHESMMTPMVTEYCRRSGIDQRSLRMQIIVQKMVQPELAGVAFTVNPVTGVDEVVVEACAGLAQELLSGRESALPSNHPLLRKHLADVVDTARRVERHFGSPQDVEFAIANDQIHLLQARPITRIGCSAINGEWTNANFREGGVSSTVCTPLMWSFYELIWNQSLKDSLREVQLLSDDFEAGRLFFARPYWNLGALKQCLARIPGFVEREFDTDLGVEIKYQGDGIRNPVTPWRLIKILPTVLAVRRYLRKQISATTRYLNAGYDAIDQLQVPDSADIDAHFRKLIEYHYFHLECNYFRTIFALSLVKMDFKHFFPDADYPALMSALPDVKHSAPLRMMQQMVERGQTDVTSLQNAFRHHYHLGLDIRHPRWDEDPDHVQLLLQQHSRRSAENAGPAYEQIRAETAARLPFWKRRMFHRKLDRLRHLVWLREEMRDLSNRMYYQIRRCVQEIAHRRNLHEDIYFMSYRDIFADDRSAIDRNREIYDRYRNFRAPNEIGIRFSDGDLPIQCDLRGLAASAGKVRGTARVAHTVQEAMLIPSGSILVSPFTDPAWTPALSRVAGVVTESGGMLSHAAVICREFGIPAVLGVPNACQRISTGSQIVVHGDQGLVELSDGPSIAK